MNEVYEVPNDELDGTEEFIETFENELAEVLSEAIDLACRVRTLSGSSGIWVILVSDENGYEKVVST